MSSMDCGPVGMVRPQKRMLLCKSTTDILSDLPSHILDRILTRLTIEDIARTSVLSKKWRFRWLSIPRLVFNRSCGKFFQTRSPTTSSIEIWFQIYQILLLHRGPLHTFSFSIPELVATEDRFITQILFYLTGKDIHKLFLCAPDVNQNRLYMIPSTTIFQYEHLTQLTLSNCEFRLPPEFIGFGKLLYLHLHCIDISPTDCQTFISTSPRLQLLRLEGLRGGSSLVEIDASNLRVLYFSCISRWLVFKNVPVLATVTIQNYDRSPGRISSFAEMFRSLPVIKNLCIDRLFLACFAAGAIPTRLPSNLKHLKSVHLSRLCFDILKDVQCALLLIRSSPNLRKLKLEAYLTKDGPENLQICRTLNEVEEDSFNQLKEVMIDFNGTKHELEFIKFLLAKSLVLKTVTIQPVEIEIDKLFTIVKVVNRYKRISSNAEIIFLD